MATVKLDGLKSWIDGIMKNEGVETYELNTEGNNLKGEGYSSEINFVNVKTATKDYDFVIKSDLKSEKLSERFSTWKIFLQENLVYSKIFPAFEQFQLEHSIREPFNNHAKYYNVSDKQKECVLVLENLKVKGFELHNRKMPMNLEHLQFVFVRYARFHAVSMAMKQLKPEMFRSITKDLEDLFIEMIPQSNLDSALIQYMTRALKLVSPIEAKKFQGYESEIENMFRRTTYDPEDSITVVLHGDCWSSNMMFKYDRADKTKPIDAKFLDLQISRIAHPILDLSYFLYSCCNKEIGKHFDSLLGLYHSTLSDSLSQYGVDVNTFFPLTKLRGDWRKFSIFGLSMALLVMQMALCDSSEALDFKEIVENDQDVGDSFLTIMKEDERYNEKVKAILEHFSETFL